MPREQKYKEGELIELQWDGSPDAFYIRGHVSSIEARTIGDIELDVYVLSSPEHKFARWSCDAQSEYDHTLVEYDSPGRGRFKVTKLRVLGGLSCQDYAVK